MKRSLAFALLCLTPLTSFAADDLEQRAQQSRAFIKELSAGLKAQLKGSMETQGPAQAINVCKEVAPAIMSQHAQERGWDIGRASLKPRNPNNAPDAWEQAVLEQFEQRKAAGEDPAKLEYFEVIEENGSKSFRYMKAIPTAAEPCLVCHGSDIRPDVAAVLDEHYPGDQARGYKAGDIRGGFSITQPMP